MFFFFFNIGGLYDIPEVRTAFHNICGDKLRSDGYFDMRKYIYARFRKEDILSSLRKINSKYAKLYIKAYPKKDAAKQFWVDQFGEKIIENIALKDIEATGIVYWVYRLFDNIKQRRDFTYELFSHIKELSLIQHNIRYSKGVFYNEEKIELKIISSVEDFHKIITKNKEKDNCLFFRGHADCNYRLQPSVFRTEKSKKNESKMYNELLIECPNNFISCDSHLEKLVEMQHYGLPTRLLDITRNPLIALYFACENKPDAFGEIVMISVPEENIKYPQSDTISLLASLPTFSSEKQEEFRRACCASLNQVTFNKAISRLVHEVRLEKPAFKDEVVPQDLMDSFVVYAIKNNQRIVKQDGAFILCGLNDEIDSLNAFRYRTNEKTLIILVNQKQKILDELSDYSINRATLFPEIDSVAEYLKGKYV